MQCNATQCNALRCDAMRCNNGFHIASISVQIITNAKGNFAVFHVKEFEQQLNVINKAFNKLCITDTAPGDLIWRETKIYSPPLYCTESGCMRFVTEDT